MRARSITLSALLAAAVPTAALADNAIRPERIPNKARQLAEKGRSYHNGGEYTQAIAAFKEAYVLAPSPSLLFNIAQSYRLAGNCDEASWMYRRFLDTNPIGDHKTLAEAHLSSVEKCGSGGLRVTLPETAPDVVNVPDPGKLQLTTSLRSDDRSRTYKRVGLGIAIGGGAALVGAAIFALDARDAENTVAETYKRGGRWQDIQDADARGRRSSTIATALGIGGGVAVASGAVLYLVGRHYEKAQHIAVTPTGRAGAQVSLTWGF